ncbi:MAG: DUF29 domain-containing protein [Syntrophobacteraceae bacterium]
MNPELYEKDFYEWTQKNAQLLREGRLSEIDLDNLIEELESMGRSEKRAFINRLAVLIAHLLKWEYQPERRSKNWRYTIKEQRRKVMDLLEDSPSLKHEIRQRIRKAYDDAVVLAVKDTELDEAIFPATCPYKLEQIMGEDFFPGENP